MNIEDSVPDQRELPGLSEGQVLGDRYRVERKIGGGGMGEVFLAKHLRTGRPLAVKLLGVAAAREPEAVERFEREARVLGSLGHPGIVGIHDFGEAPGGRPYLVMDFLQGEELAARLDRSGAMSWSDAARIFEEVSGALHAAHGLGVLHRDLKPGNIFLARSAAAPERAVLLDFGLSKDLSDEEKRLTRTGMIMGTPLYMSPEQARGQPLDVRSDIYSLAAVLYELLSGRPPFEGSSWTAILSALLLDPPAPFSPALLESLPPQVDGAMRRALSKDPGFRPGDVLQFASEVLGRPPIWAASLEAPVAAGGVTAGSRGFVTGPTAWADSGDVLAEGAASARTVPSGPPLPAAVLSAPSDGPASAARAGRRRFALLLILGGLGLLGLGAFAALGLSGAFRGHRERREGKGASDRLAEAEIPLSPQVPPPVDARAAGDSGAGRDAAGTVGVGALGPAREGTPPTLERPSPSGDPAGRPTGEPGMVPEPPRLPVRVPGHRVSHRPAPVPRPAVVPPPPPPERPRTGGPPAPMPVLPQTYAQMIAHLPANEQAALAAMQKSDWPGCLRATRQPPESERILQMRIGCAWQVKAHDLVVSTCKRFQKRFPSHPYAKACDSQIRAIDAIKKYGSGMKAGMGTGNTP